MADSPLLELTAADLKARLNPTDDPNLLQYGGASLISQADVESIVAEGEDEMVSGLPEKYRRLTRAVEGEIVVWDAAEGQTVFRLGLAPVLEADSPQAGDEPLALYVDFGRGSYAAQGNSGGGIGGGVSSQVNPMGVRGSTPYEARTRYDRLAASKYELNPTTGVVTLIEAAALKQGQRVFADYRHGYAPSISKLRGIALDLAASILLMRYPSLISDGGLEYIRELRKNAADGLGSLYAGGDKAAGIDAFDRLRLEHETRNTNGGLRLPLLMGM